MPARHRGVILVFAALLLASSGLGQAWHVLTFHGGEPCESGQAPVSAGLETDAAVPADCSDTSAPAPHEDPTDDCPQCELQRSASKATLLWTGAPALIAPPRGFLPPATDQRAVSTDAPAVRRPRGPPALLA